MKSWYGSGSVALCALSALILAGCQGLKTATPTAPTTTYQLTVTAPASGAGTITSSPAGISCPGTCSASFAANTQVTLTETAGANYFFSGWSGSCTGTGACTVTLTAAATVSAAFNAGDGLTVALAGTGTGTVTSSSGGISCTPTCSASFAPNTQVTLTASPTGGSTFTGWSGGGCSGAGACSVTVASSESVTATFTAAVVVTNDTLTVTLAGTGQGTVASSPAGISCTSGTCTGSFPANTQIILTETPGANSSFTSWSGCTGTTTCTFTLTAAQTVTATFGPTNPYAALSHIILFAQENRSLDHYFGAMLSYWSANGYGTNGQTFNGLAQFNPPVNGVTPLPPTVPGCAAGTWSGSCSPDASDPISSFHLQSACMENQSPFWNEAHNQWDYADPTGSNPVDLSNPPLDGFAFTAAYDAGSNGFMDLEGVRAMGYYDGNDLNYYYFMASNFATSDSWFAPIMSRTQLNRMYMLAATSHGLAYPIGTGCPPSQCAGSTNTGNQLSSMTIFEELQNAGISWKIYVDAEDTVNKTGQSCSAMSGTEESACLVENSYINEFDYENTILNNPTLLANIQPLTVFQSDAAAGTLPAFALIEPASDAGLDEHPSDSDEYPENVQSGQSYAYGSVINPLMTSKSWSTSALIFTYDEWGGLYDHVPPQPATAPGDGPYDAGDPSYPTDLFSTDICGKEAGQLGTGMCSFSWTGYRIPLIVISPFAKQNYVSHDVMDTTAVLAMVEDRFGLAPLTNRDASYNSAQTAHATMAEFFDFTNPPWMTPPANVPTPNTNLQCSQVPVPGTYSPGGGWGEPVNLSVAVSSPGGTITSSPPGISCNTDYTWAGTDVCGYVFPAGTVVTLTETPNNDTFKDWSGEGNTAGPCNLSTSSTCTITLSTGTDEYVQANFN
ncbi:MAG: alkaline phosphatase family protein [Candidatus Sulfotelmatobacter sp.]